MKKHRKIFLRRKCTTFADNNDTSYVWNEGPNSNPTLITPLRNVYISTFLPLTHSIPACNCNEAGTTHEICASVTENGVEAGTCICKANVLPSAKCDSCKPEHYGLDASNPLGCTGMYLAVKFGLGVKFGKKLTTKDRI